MGRFRAAWLAFKGGAQVEASLDAYVEVVDLLGKMQAMYARLRKAESTLAPILTAIRTGELDFSGEEPPQMPPGAPNGDTGGGQVGDLSQLRQLARQRGFRV